MICKMCSTGAEVIRRAKELNEEHHALPVDYNDVKVIGSLLHTYCKGCDCQHKEQNDKRLAKGYPRSL